MDNVIQHVKIEDIVPRNHQYNLSDIKSLEDLAISIKENGIKEPLRLKKTKGKYEIIEGNRRFRAAILAGLTEVPATVEDYDYNKLLNYITGNDDSYPKSISNNSDVINLSELSKEYERDDFNMNNELMNNNIPQQPLSGNANTPTFGGRFFPSLEDEPTNMAFNTTIEPAPQPSSNNFIDLTDTNVQAPVMPEQPQNIGIENNMTQPIQEPIMNQSIETPIDNNIMPQNTSNVLSIESLMQNNSMVSPSPVVEPMINTIPENIIVPQSTQVAEPINVDNNFQEIASDFQPLQNPNIDIVPEPVMEPQIVSEPVAVPVNDINQMVNEPINISNEIQTPIMEQPVQPAMPENINVMQPEQIIQPQNPIENVTNFGMQQPMQEPMMPEQPVVEPTIQTMPEINVQQPIVENPVSPKDVLPVINTLKAVGINLENFGYTIRITDEDLPTSYKITIEVEK